MLKSDQSPRYVIITPVRDEEKYIAATIESVVSQTIRPAEWVIVDDGSTDATGTLIDRYAARYSWISATHQVNRGGRDAEVGAVGAFLRGFRTLQTTDWQFIVNLDGDMGLESDYFERCLDKFTCEPRLGIGGGTVYYRDETGNEVIETCPSSHVRGATKIYRRECWEAIGGLGETPGWDTLDEVKANMSGWRTGNFKQIRALHRRPTGAAGGSWRDSVKNGRCDYFLGYHPLFMLVKCVKRLFVAPYVLGGVGHLSGFMGGYVQRRPQINSKQIVRYVRTQQLRRLALMDSTWR